MSKHHTKLIMAAVFGVFFLTVGLATGAYLSKQNQDTRNQAWGGNNGGWQWNWRNGTPPRNVTIPARPPRPSVTIPALPTGFNRVRVDDRYLGPPIKANDYKQYLTGNTCDAQSYTNACNGNVLTACTRTGKEIRANCANFDATCGVAPVGLNAGEAVCIPNNLGSRNLPNGITLREAYQKYYSGSCNNVGKTSCDANVMTACLPGGKQVTVPCKDIDPQASCGTIPSGPHAGQASCIPPLPAIPEGSLRRGDSSNDQRSWPTVTYPSITIPPMGPWGN